MKVKYIFFCFFFQAEDGIRDLVRSRGLGDVYKRQVTAGRSWISRTSTTDTDAGASSTFSGRRDAVVTTGFNSVVTLSLIHI